MVAPAGRRRRPRFTIIVMTLLSITVLTLDARNVPVVSSVREGVMQVLEPVEGALGWIATPARNAWNGIGNYGELEEENARLRAEIDRLEAEGVNAEAASEQLRRLQEQLGIPFLEDYETVVAQVSTGNYSTFDDNTAQINRGSSSGIKVGQSVTTNAGFIGTIMKVSKDRAVVRLITDPDFRVGVRLSPTDALGVGRGTGAGNPWLIDESVGLNVEVEEGEKVFTSGLGRSRFAPGLPIGTVTKITRDQGQQLQILEVEMAADLGRLDYVQVLMWEPPA